MTCRWLGEAKHQTDDDEHGGQLSPNHDSGRVARLQLRTWSDRAKGAVV